MTAPDEFIHATRKLDVPNPFRLRGGVTAAAGALLCALGAIPLLERLSDGSLAYLLARGVTPATLALFWRLLIAVVTLLSGLSLLVSSFHHRFRLWVPPGTPKVRIPANVNAQIGPS